MRQYPAKGSSACVQHAALSPCFSDATRVLYDMRACAAPQVLEAEKEATPKIEAKAQELKEQTKDVREEVGARAREVVGSAKEAQKEASAQVEDTVNVAQDTIDLVSKSVLTCSRGWVEEGQQEL